MLDFISVKDTNGDAWIETSLSGKPLLTTPQLNKGTAFSLAERLDFGLIGKLPARVESLEEQVARAYEQFNAYKDLLKKNIYLNGLHDTNQVLFYKLVSEHLAEMLPVIYTPIVGTAVKQFSREFRQPRGLYISYPEQQYLEQILANRSNPDIDLIVVTDGEGVLGIGDQGVGGMDIPIAKLMVYTLCAGIDPTRTLPIQIDVGTNNQALLDDPFYLGWRHERLKGAAYDEFVERFVNSINSHFPQVFLHWEDFGRENARRNLDRYREKICTFNDDMQGTGVVTLSAILAGVRANQSQLKDQRIVVFGGGTAGTGISDQICQAMEKEGLSLAQARRQFWLLDRFGLLTESYPELTPYQQVYARPNAESRDWQQSDGHVNLLEVIRQVKPTILIGCSAVAGAFTREVIEEMARHTPRPIILPLSNPTERCEAQPNDIYQWTQGQALIATGSPFADITYQGRQVRFAQCNNALVFPGIGLGLIAAKAKTLSDDGLWTACQALSEFAPINKDPHGPLLPDLSNAREVATHIALAVARQAVAEGASAATMEELPELIKQCQWQPHYVPFKHRPA